MLPPIIPFDATRILSDEEVVAAAAALRVVMARSFPGLDPELYGDVEHTVRLLSLGTRLKRARETAGLGLKDLSVQTKVPQFRLRAIEEGHQHHLKGAIIARYAAALGELEWLGAWMAANAALTKELRLDVPGAEAPASGKQAAGENGKARAPKSQIMRLRITLRDIEPPVWRLIEIAATATYRDLHAAIQASMGWRDAHLHVFRVPDGNGGVLQIGAPDPHGMYKVIDGARRRVREHLTASGQELAYIYDFGDDWWHTVTLEAIAPREPGAPCPRCLDGARRCPPEDCGGPPGYERLLEAISRTSHREHRAMLEWCGGAFDPEAFVAGDVMFGKRLGR